MSPVLTAHRQFGSKARVARQLLELVPRDVRVWAEVFAGTAAVTLAKPPHGAEHINDLNGEVVNLFRVMRDPGQLAALCRQVDLTPYSETEFRDCCSTCWGDAAENELRDPVERARRFLVATWQGIGGKQIPNSSWRLDVGQSWLTSTWNGVPKRLAIVAKRLKLTQVHQKDAGEFIAMFSGGPEAFLFIDPPYPRDTLATHERVYSVDMEPAAHEALARQLAGVSCRVLLTMAKATIYEDVLQGWHRRTYEVRGMRNQVKEEIALMNYEPPARTLFCPVPA